jgi:FKBP-type peptidyl-prolyl cis-trans isomerase FklB
MVANRRRRAYETKASKMKKNILLRMGICGAALCLAVSGQRIWAQDAAPKTEAEKASYALGMNLAGNVKRTQEALKGVGVELDVTNFLRGLKDTLTGSPTLVSSNDMVTILTALSEKAKAAEETKANAQGSTNLKAGKEFLDQNKTKPGVVALADGLQYKILKQGSGAMPKTTDTVSVNYRGTLIDGTEFDASPAGQPISFPLGGVIKGWTEILQLMPVGSKWQVFIPSDLAYGPRAAGPKIGPNSTLIFEIELLSITDANGPK